MTTRKNFQTFHHFVGKATFWLEYAQCVAVVIAAEVINDQSVSGTSHQLTTSCLISVILRKCLTQSYILQFSHQTIANLCLHSFKNKQISKNRN